jgi:hypothetical protein
VIVVADPALPTPDLSVRTSHGEARVGDGVRVTRGDLMRVELRGVPAGARVEVLWNGEPIAAAEVPDGGAVTFTGIPPALRQNHLARPDGTLLAVTNPIFIEITAP